MLDLLICAATSLESDLLQARAEVLRTGVGCVNAAYALTKFLERRDVRRIVICGIGGAYPESGLGIGDVVCAESECYGDLGVETPDGFLDMASLGFAMPALPMQIHPCERRLPFVTVNTCSGVDALSTRLQQRTGGGVENMEGAAFAHVASLAGVPIGEIRGISNFTGDRDRATWRVREAADSAQQALISWIKTL